MNVLFLEIIRLQPRVTRVNPRNDPTRFFKIHLSAHTRFLAGAREARLPLVALVVLRPRRNKFLAIYSSACRPNWLKSGG